MGSSEQLLKTGLRARRVTAGSRDDLSTFLDVTDIGPWLVSAHKEAAELHDRMATSLAVMDVNINGCAN